MRDLVEAVRGARLQPGVRRLLRWWTARWLVRLGTAAVALVLLVELVAAWGDGDREQVTSSVAPSRERVDAAIADAERYVDRLYREVAPGRAVVSEYYGLPLRALVGSPGKWVRPGDPELSITSGEQSLLRESYLFEYVLDPAAPDPVELLTVVRWDQDDGSAEIEVSQVGGDLDEPLSLSLDRRRLAEQRPSSTERVFSTRVAGDEYQLLRSLRYTIRHVTMMSAAAYAFRDRPDRARPLAALVRETGYDPEADVYSPIWGRGEREPDDFVFDESVYRDCTDPEVVPSMPESDGFYPYQSKVCTIPTWGYVAMSREDPLAVLAQGLHVLQRYGDPEHEYSDGEHLNTTVIDLVTEMERRYRTWGGIAECLPGSCDTGATSTLRTVLFGMIETELAFGRGDEVSRTYADQIAADLLEHQVGQDGIVPTTRLGDLYRPAQAGGFFTHVSNDRAGEPDSFTRKQMNLLADLLDIRPEYTGEITTNAETTLVAYAFLVHYRCARFGTDCDRLS
ncbi:MAG: hypothetical protein WBP61_08745 [Nocardioides sp.]